MKKLSGLVSDVKLMKKSHMNMKSVNVTNDGISADERFHFPPSTEAILKILRHKLTCKN